MKKILTSVIFVALILPITALGQSSPPAIPLLVYGNVSLYGMTPPAGAEISVSNGGTIIATTTVNSAGKYFFQIPASNAGSSLTYKIGSLVATEKVCLNPLQYASDNINLIIAAPTPPPSGGGGGGGGGYTPPSSSPLSIEAQKVDANKDNKVDMLDFVTLMANWGKMGTGNIADFNSDGKVDILDFVALMANWTI